MVFMENTMSTGKAAKLLGVTAKTLQRWEREGRLIPAARTGTNRRLYTESQIREFIGLRRWGAVPTRLVAEVYSPITPTPAGPSSTATTFTRTRAMM